MTTPKQKYRNKLRENNLLQDYDKRHNKTVKERTHKNRFGEYIKLFHCEICINSEKRLLIHHKYYTSCSDCAPNGKDMRGSCKILTHIQTLCYQCHNKIHRQVDYRIWKDMKEMDKHLESMRVH